MFGTYVLTPPTMYLIAVARNFTRVSARDLVKKKKSKKGSS